MNDTNRSGVRFLGWAPLLWYVVFLLGPLVLVFATSFATRGLYGGIEWRLSFENFTRAIDPLYFSILLKSFFLSLGTTIACFALGFPVAYSMATASARSRNILILLLAIPFLTNLVIRICALRAFTSFDGPLASLLTVLRVGFDPYLLSQNAPLVAFGMISTYLPFMVFPLYASLERFDFTLVEAAEDLGATFVQVCTRVVLPALKGAMLSGVLLVFIPAMGEFLIPDLLGGAKVMLAGNLVSEQFLKARDWPFGSALSFLLMLLLGLVVIAVRRWGEKSVSTTGASAEFSERVRPRAPRLMRSILPLVLVALYLPLLVMVLNSFSGWSLSWYRELFDDPSLWTSLGRSLVVAFSSSLITTVLAAFAALGLEKFVFNGRWPMRVLSTISLMLPELVLSLSLLSWFSVLHWELSLQTVAIAHVTLTLPFAILVIAARLQTMDAAVEDAARDLGAGEWQVLWRVTLPLLKPALISAFTLAFLLSFDDFLVTYFTNGSGGDTLPVKLYSLMKTGLTPKVQALSTLMLALSVGLVAILVKLRPR